MSGVLGARTPGCGMLGKNKEEVRMQKPEGEDEMFLRGFSCEKKSLWYDGATINSSSCSVRV